MARSYHGQQFFTHGNLGAASSVYKDMRALLGLILVASCGKEAVRPVEKPVSAKPLAAEPVATAPIAEPSAPPVPPAPAAPFAALTTSKTWFVVEVEGRTASCRPWTIDPDAKQLTSKRPTHTATFSYELTDTTLKLTDHQLTRAEDDWIASSCDQTFPLKNAPDGHILVDAAMWFADAATCETAVREHRRVAMNMTCALELPALEKAANVTQTRFERLLAKGGSLYSIVAGPKGDTCQRVRVKSRGKHEGTFEWDVVREDDGVKGIYELGYSLGRTEHKTPRLWLTGPGGTWADGTSWAMGCLDEQHIEYREDHVQLQQPAYFTLKACKAAIADQQAELSWFALPDDGVAESGASSSPGIGGC